jgi:hypothetical protein
MLKLNGRSQNTPVELDNANSRLGELLGLCRFALGEFAAARQAWDKNAVIAVVHDQPASLIRLSSVLIVRYFGCCDKTSVVRPTIHPSVSSPNNSLNTAFQIPLILKNSFLRYSL